MVRDNVTFEAEVKRVEEDGGVEEARVEQTDSRGGRWGGGGQGGVEGVRGGVR